jgi:RNA polymerase sigma-70 factor (ECF subfamily)
MTLPEAERHLSPALEAAVVRFGTLVRQVGRRYRLEESGLDQVMQEVRIRLQRARGTGEQVGETSASCVYRTASSAALDILRRRRARHADRHESRLGGLDLARRAARAVGQISTSGRPPVRMYLAGYSRDEIARLMGWTDARTRDLLDQGLADFGERLTTEDNGWEAAGGELMKDARLREVHGGTMASQPRGGRSSPCPEPEAIHALTRREGGEDERLAILDEVMSCPDCRSEFDLLRSIELAGEQAGDIRRRTGRWLAPAALAAAVLLALAAARLALPGAPAREIVRSAAADRVALAAPPGEASTGLPLLFAWRPVPGASRYRLEVLTTDGEIVLEAETAETAIVVQSAADLAPGEYRWWVAATVPGAAARSALRPIRLTAP